MDFRLDGVLAVGGGSVFSVAGCMQRARLLGFWICRCWVVLLWGRWIVVPIGGYTSMIWLGLLARESYGRYEAMEHVEVGTAVGASASEDGSFPFFRVGSLLDGCFDSGAVRCCHVPSRSSKKRAMAILHCPAANRSVEKNK